MSIASTVALRLTLPLLLLAGGAGCQHPPARSADAPSAPDSARLAADVRFLASDALEGRATGTAGNDSAQAFIARRFAALRLDPVVVPTPCPGECPAGFVQPFTATSAAAAHAGLAAAMPTANVVALIPGRDPRLKGQVVVLGAHYDHLGRWSFGAMDPDRKNEIHNGADDNASGVATILELARLFKVRPAARSVAIVAFSGEEIGLLGSSWFVEHPPFPLDSVQAMLNFDMVGRLRDDKLMVYGTATAREMADIVTSANEEPAFKLVAIGDGTGPSDHSSFYLKDLPVLHFFTDLHDDYHRVTDDAERINAAGMARVTAYAERIARTLADRPERLSFVRSTTASTSMGSASRTGAQVYLGSVPDMGAPDIKGMRLSGVRAGSPADLGGLKAGDIIVELGGTAISDLYSYTEALYRHAPGDMVRIVVQRGTERITLTVTLGKRSN